MSDILWQLTTRGVRIPMEVVGVEEENCQRGLVLRMADSGDSLGDDVDTGRRERRRSAVSGDGGVTGAGRHPVAVV